MQDVLDYTREAAKWVGHLAKIMAVLSVIIGMTLLLGYLHSAGAGLTFINASFGAILTFLAAIFAWFSLIALSLVLMPALAMAINAKDTRVIFPELYSQSPVSESYLRQYLSHFRAYLIMVITFFIVDRELSAWNRAPWYVFVITMMCFSFFAGLHYLITANSSFLKVVVLYCTFITLSAVIWPGISCIGGLALRFAGMGGGIPISILVKTMEPGSSQIVAKEVKGCLVLATMNPQKSVVHHHSSWHLGGCKYIM